ncbi:MAG: hypothetical protein ACRD1N_10615, partial [Terriglobia bacterium]
MAPETLSKRERKAVQVLVEEVEKRTEIRWPVARRLGSGGRPEIVAGSEMALKQVASELLPGLIGEDRGLSDPEGYRLRAVSNSGSPLIVVSGAGERGVLCGVGGLLRRLRMSKQQVALAAPLDIATSPKYKLRGHQMGYRPKTNAYDGWSVSMWDQYYRD